MLDYFRNCWVHKLDWSDSENLTALFTCDQFTFICTALWQSLSDYHIDPRVFSREKPKLSIKHYRQPLQNPFCNWIHKAMVSFQLGRNRLSPRITNRYSLNVQVQNFFFFYFWESRQSSKVQLLRYLTYEYCTRMTSRGKQTQLQ